jgi:signal transduction histidine kinase
MIPFPSVQETERLDSLKRYHILDTQPEVQYDEITALAAAICEAPISLLTLVDKDRQWFKSAHGLNITETDREYSFCSVAIETPDQPFILDYIDREGRFGTNPFVVGEPFVKSYFGIPINSLEGQPLGTLCVIDTKERKLSESQLNSLQFLARQASRFLDFHRTRIELNLALRESEVRNTELERFAHVAAHDLKSPLNNMTMITKILASDFAKDMSAEALELVSLINKTTTSMREMIDNILIHAKDNHTLKSSKQEFNLDVLLKEIIRGLDKPDNCQFVLPDKPHWITSNKTALYQIFSNLISNSLKYNESEIVEIKVEFAEDNKNFHFDITDNGSGISGDVLSTIFDIFKTGNTQDRFGNHGTGVGLSTVKRLIDRANGSITIDSKVNQGTTVHFSIPK